MKLFVFLALINFPFTRGVRDIPRLILRQDRIDNRLEYNVHQNHTVFFHPEDSDELYVGGTDFVFQIDVECSRIIELFPLSTTGGQTCGEGPCENVITVIQKFQDSLFVCGTNGNKPQCWKLYSQMPNHTHEIVESYEGTGLSPYVYSQNALSLTVEGDLYAAAPLYSDGSSLQFRRKAGSRTNVWMYNKWVTEPTFISACWVRRREEPANEKIYIFFREKNSDSSPEADPWISRVAQVCKVDEGGSKRFFQNMWTSFLKARLVCGIPNESLYFNRLQDIFVLHAEEWRDSQVYALFTSSWNGTAVCVYSMAEIDRIFQNSPFKGYNEDIPNPRPGTCVPNSKDLPLATVNVIKDHPEMTDWIHPIQPYTPFYISNYYYTKIAVDRVQAADHTMHNVLLLATDTGMIHKILKDGFKPFIISETHLSNHSDVIRSMKLDSRKRKLVVGLSEQISILDLQRCQDYNVSCAECVLARDPYCAWTEAGCRPTVPGGIQNINGGQTNVCPKTAEAEIAEEPKMPTSNRTRRDTQPSHPPSPSSSRNALGVSVHSLPLDVPFYLSCPIDSYHAHYSWEHLGTTHPCLRLQASCLHLIPSMQTEHYGNYRCVSKERDYTRVVREVRATQLLNNPNPAVITRPLRPARPMNRETKTNGGTAVMAGRFGTFAALAILVRLLQ
ncbi:hypothetical protein J4Q44_G00209080 [Coregonus suidteri]|uniref:Sema domain-containing protein n=1 Tax=Coregonus suidteri TaxID=861788 RepID=A0AAN8LNN4_9TELE